MRMCRFKNYRGPKFEIIGFVKGVQSLIEIVFTILLFFYNWYQRLDRYQCNPEHFPKFDKTQMIIWVKFNGVATGGIFQFAKWKELKNIIF